MPQLETWQAIAAVIVLSLLFGFGQAIGAWAWARLCARFGW